VEQRSILENSGVRVCDLILGSPLGRVRLANRLKEAVGWLWAEQVERREADTELEGLWNSATQVQDLVLGGPTGMSSHDSVIVLGHRADRVPHGCYGSQESTGGPDRCWLPLYHTSLVTLHCSRWGNWSSPSARGCVTLIDEVLENSM
jgi:hypothetical protein